MDWVNIQETAMEYGKKYRYVILVLLIGLLLMAIPQAEDKPVVAESARPAPVEEVGLQNALESLLSQLEGAGRVKVLLTQAAGEQTIYQTDEDRDSGGIRLQTVIVTDTQRGENGLVRQTLPPEYLGAVVLCQGADSAAVRLAVIQAVSSATGLASHNIAVLKMK